LVLTIAIVVVFVLAIHTHVATAQAAQYTLVLAIDDVELRRALAAELEPWHVTIVTDHAPVDAMDADAIAIARGARFIVWRERDELVVYDRASRLTARRKARAGAFDEAAAASAAASVKTILRLPPFAPAPSPAPTNTDVGVRVDLGAAARSAGGSTEARFGARAAVRIWNTWGWWFGIAGELGTSTEVQNASFKGSWSDWSVLATAAYSFQLTPVWALEPGVAIGVTRSALAGTEQMATRDEDATLLALQASLIVRARLGRWSIGGGISGGFLADAPSYTMSQGAALIYQVPTYELSAGIVIGTEIMR
jgi:hypothetical protein